MKLRYARPGNAQFIAKIFVFNMVQRKLQSEKCTRGDIYISNMCFAFNCLVPIDRGVERTIRLRKMPSVVAICFLFLFFLSQHHQQTQSAYVWNRYTQELSVPSLNAAITRFYRKLFLLLIDQFKLTLICKCNQTFAIFEDKYFPFPRARGSIRNVAENDSAFCKLSLVHLFILAIAKMILYAFSQQVIDCISILEEESG